MSKRKTIWLCSMCGKPASRAVGDKNCHPVEVFEDSIERNLDGHVKAAQAVDFIDKIKRAPLPLPQKG